MPGRRNRLTPDDLNDPPIHVVLVEPRTLVGIGVRHVLGDEPGIEIVAEVRSPGEAMDVVARTTPDVVLVDADLSEPDVSRDTRRLHQEAPYAAIVVVAREDDAGILDAIEVGARAVVDEAAEPGELVDVIRRCAEGADPIKDEIATRPELVEKVVDAVRNAHLAPNRAAAIPLTARELQILRLVARGMRNREIASVLGVSEQTIKNHLTNAMHKTGVPNRTQAVTLAVRNGWLSLEAVSEEPARRP